jgi:hypothetical protein
MRKRLDGVGDDRLQRQPTIQRNLTLDSELMTVKTNEEMSMTEHVLCGSGEIETK